MSVELYKQVTGGQLYPHLLIFWDGARNLVHQIRHVRSEFLNRICIVQTLSIATSDVLSDYRVGDIEGP
jgi:hypothetical protein